MVYLNDSVDVGAYDNNYACVLVIPNFCTEPDKLLEELLFLEWDKKAIFRGEVKNKNARHNLCFTDQSREADYKNGIGSLVSFSELPLLNEIRNKASQLLPEEIVLYAEGNLYYDISKTYIGLHGDTERSLVIGLRLGDQIPLHFQWFQRSKAISKATTIDLNHGDLYIISYKAVGNDWKKKVIPTLRHAAGGPSLIKGILL
jgi:hypothetical protein